MRPARRQEEINEFLKPLCRLTAFTSMINQWMTNPCFERGLLILAHVHFRDELGSCDNFDRILLCLDENPHQAHPDLARVNFAVCARRRVTVQRQGKPPTFYWTNMLSDTLQVDKSPLPPDKKTWYCLQNPRGPALCGDVRHLPLITYHPDNGLKYFAVERDRLFPLLSRRSPPPSSTEEELPTIDTFCLGDCSPLLESPPKKSTAQDSAHLSLSGGSPVSVQDVAWDEALGLYAASTAREAASKRSKA